MKIAFFGDSLTEGYPGAAYFPLLQKRFPTYELINYGKGGDTVISLLKRIESQYFPQIFDLAFVWIGVNDVFVRISPLYPLIKRLRGQPWAKDQTMFRSHYQKLLQVLSPRADFLSTVPPLFIGEDLQNPWNCQLEALNTTIKELSSNQDNCGFVDLRDICVQKLKGQKTSPYTPKRFTRIIWDALSSGTKQAVDSESLERGLHMTLDGVHLNSAGAGLVADVFAGVIEARKKSLFHVG